MTKIQIETDIDFVWEICTRISEDEAVELIGEIDCNMQSWEFTFNLLKKLIDTCGSEFVACDASIPDGFKESVKALLARLEDDKSG